MTRRPSLVLAALAASSSAPPVAVSAQGAAAGARARALAHLERGNGYYGAGDLGRAASEYQSCLDATTAPPPDDRPLQGCLINLASVLVDMGGDEGGGVEEGATNVARAEALYRRALELDPSDGDASFNLALLLQDRRTESSSREAAALYGVAVKADPDRWDAWANMASALSEIKEEPLRAIYAYERSILLIEGSAEEEEGEERDPARDAYLSVLYYGYGLQLSDLSPEACRTLAAAPRSLLIGKERIIDGKGGGEDGGGAELCAENAHNALRSAAALDPGNVQAAHMLAAIEAERGGGGGGGDDGGGDGDGSSAKLRRATPEFVAALFDDFADTFNEKLGSLGYKVPALVGRAAAEVLSARPGGRASFRSALDAGCGTGLAGRYLRPLVDGPLIGVDISRKMLDVARECTTASGCGANETTAGEEEEDGDGESSSSPLYDGLMPLDLETMTLEQTLGSPDVARRRREGGEGGGGEDDDEAFDLIVAADVLVYFGGLDALLSNFARLSARGSALIFSCERASDDEAPGGWRLRSSGRFAHSKAYVVETARGAGYGLAGYEEIVPRMEKGEEVKGHLFRFVKEGGGSGGKEEL